MANNYYEQLLLASKKQNAATQILSEAFEAQQNFILDPSKRKAAFVLRRGGKSTALAIYLIYAALENPRTKSLYMALTRDSAENIMWLNVIEPLLQKHNISHIFNRTKKTITFENKSTIQLTGTDASDSQISKYVGGRYLLAVFDECQDIRHDLRHWIDDRLGPAMLDYGGTICCAGTAGKSIGRYWYDITNPLSQLKSWTIHSWSGDDNPFMADKIEAEIQRLKNDNPLIEKDEGFRNQYLCEWVLDNTDRVYHNREYNLLTDKQLINSLLSGEKKWQYMIGFDFGFEDATAFIVSAFSKHDSSMYIVETFKKEQMLTEETAEKLHELRSKYHPIYMVGDCQNKTLIQTLRQQYRLPLRPADKLGKLAHIALMNSDFTVNKIRIIPHLNEPLLKEWASLIWNETNRAKGEFKEKASKDNHAADACLYVHHFSKHYRATPEPELDPRPRATETERRFKEAQLSNYNAAPNTGNPIYDAIDTMNWINEYRMTR